MGKEGGLHPNEYDYDWKFETTATIGNYRVTNLTYGMFCEPISPDIGQKETDKLRIYHLVNTQNLTTNREILV